MNIVFRDLKLTNDVGLIRILTAAEAWGRIFAKKNSFPARYDKLRGLAESADLHREVIFDG